MFVGRTVIAVGTRALGVPVTFRVAGGDEVARAVVGEFVTVALTEEEDDDAELMAVLEEDALIGSDFDEVELLDCDV